MDPITAIGLASTIFQFIELGIKVAKRVDEFTAAIDDVPKTFKQIRTELPLIVDGLRRIQRNIDSRKVDKGTEEALVPVVKGCLAEIEQLDKILEKALPSADASAWGRRWKAAISLTYDKKIEEIAESLDGYIRTLMFHQVIDNMNFTSFKVELQPPPYPKPFWLVPFDRNASFVGRDDIFTDIEDAFAVQESSQPKAALCGLGGIGKSQVALEYCYRRRRKDDRCSVFWVNAATVARFEESLKRIAGECNIANLEDSNSDAVLLLKGWLEARHEGPWLMVVDNVDDQDAFFREKTTFGKTPSECIPHCQNGSLLFTTRSRDVAVDVASPATPITIHEMGKAEGLELVRKRLRDGYCDDIILQLLQELEYIPLAITQAVAFMAKRRKTIPQYLEQYRKNDSTRTKFLSYEFSDHGRQESRMESVAKTWKLSFETIRDSNPRAADLLCLINFFQHQGIPAILLQGEVEDEFDFQEAAALLKAFSFIDGDDDDSVFSTHRLVQLATRWWLEEESPLEVDRWAFAALKSVTAQFPKPTHCPGPEYFKLSEILLPHAELMLRYQFKSTSKEMELVKAKLLNSSGRYLHWNGNFDEVRLRFEKSLEINQRYLGEKHIDTMESAGHLGWALNTYSGDIKAIPILEQLLENRREVLGEDDPRTIDCLSDLAVAIAIIGDLPKSENMQREALACSERVLGRRHHDTLNCMEHLASVLEDQNKMIEAIQLQRVVYETRKDLYGPRHPVILVTEHNLAIMLGADEETVMDAIELYQHNLAIKREILGVDHRETLVTAYALVITLGINDKFEEAKELCQRTLEETSDGPRKDNAHSQKIINQIREYYMGVLLG
ncbi:Nephrocystin-3-like protein [Cladobotryum mycophilum]|uniref:Nephrocystin-3-like protein n=1 Tax=Cladobotryum mycophilum TaxID=491253 RepID=A0ABR0S878_9HYPO